MRFALVEYGSVFSTRPRGAELLQRLLDQADGAREVEIDFDGVRSVSYSFADAFFGELMSGVVEERQQFHVVIENASSHVRRALLASVRNRGLSEDPFREPTAP